MAIDGFAFNTISTSRVLPDAPGDTTLMTDIRDALEFLMRWMGRDFLANAIANHNHDGNNSSRVAGASGGLGIASFAWAGTGNASGGDFCEMKPKFLFHGTLDNIAHLFTYTHQDITTNVGRNFGLTSSSTNVPRDNLKFGGMDFGIALGMNVHGERNGAFAFDNLTGVCEVSSYTGDSNTNQSITLTDTTIAPEFVWVFPATVATLQIGVLRGPGDTGTNSTDEAGTLLTSTGIRSLDANGFTAGSALNVNGTVYGYVAFATGSAQGESFTAKTYIGNSTNPRILTGSLGTDSFRPDIAMIQGANLTGRPLQIFLASRSSKAMNWAPPTAKSLVRFVDMASDGVEITADAAVNNTGNDYNVYYFKGGNKQGY